MASQTLFAYLPPFQRVKQCQEALDVGTHICCRIPHGVPHTSLGRHVHHISKVVTGKEVGEKGAITDITPVDLHAMSQQL